MKKIENPRVLHMDFGRIWSPLDPHGLPRQQIAKPGQLHLTSSVYTQHNIIPVCIIYNWVCIHIYVWMYKYILYIYIHMYLQVYTYYSILYWHTRPLQVAGKVWQHLLPSHLIAAELTLSKALGLTSTYVNHGTNGSLKNGFGTGWSPTLWWTNILPWKITMLLMGKSTISMAIFHCYVSSPEG